MLESWHIKNVFLILLIYFLIIPTASAYYEIKCDFSVSPQKYPELVTIDSFTFSVNLTNIGNKEFPSTPVNVTIFTPRGDILESYYSFNFSLKNLSINESYPYTSPFAYKNETAYAFYEMPIPGTWEIRLTLLKLPSDNATYTYSNLIRTNGECRYYFSVKEFAQYQKEQQDKDIQNATMNLDVELERMNIILVVLAFIAIFLTIIAEEYFRNFILKKLNLITGLGGLILSILLAYVYFSNILVLIGAVVLFFSSIAIMKDWQLITSSKYSILSILYNVYTLILIALSFAINLINVITKNPIFATMGVILLIIYIFAALSFFVKLLRIRRENNSSN
jgi:hypothetical protein